MLRAAASLGLTALLAVADPGAARAAGQVQPAAPDAAAPAAAPDGELLLGVVINGADQGQAISVLRRAGQLYLRAEDLAQWRIHAPAEAALTEEGVRWVSLAVVPGARAEIDEPRQLLRLDLPPEAFAVTRLAPQRPTATLSPAAPTAFLNYDLALQDLTSDPGAASAYLEAGASNRWGLLMNTQTFDTTREGADTVRLETFFLRDDPARLRRLQVGDGLTRGAAWSRPVRFGGVRYGSDFSLQPGLATFPTPAFADRAALPSDVELYIDNALRYQSRIDPGPFTLDQAPVLSGAGTFTVVVRDMLGVERQVTQSYYVSPQLLRRGLSEFSLEAGAERRGYGVRSFDYGPAFVAGSYRRGLWDSLTIEGRAEASSVVRNVGVGGDAVLGSLAAAGVSAAVSDGDAGSGALIRAQVGRVGPRWTLSLAYETATRDYRQVGDTALSIRPRRQLQAAAGVSLGRFGNLNATHVEQLIEDSASKVTTLTYGLTVGGRAYLNVYGLRTAFDGEPAEWTAGVGLTIPFGARSSAYVQAEDDQRSLEVRRTAPTVGWGYRLAAREGNVDQQQAELAWRGYVGEATLQAARSGGETSARLLASGGFVAIGGEVRATRRVDGGVALVELPGRAGVHVYQDNQLAGRTDKDGRAVVTALRRYEPNRLRLELSDVPLDARLESDTLIVVPRPWGGVRARFALADESGASLVVQLPGGAPLEPGLTLREVGGRMVTYSGYDGEVFVPALKPGLVLEAKRPQGRCRVVAPRPPPDEILPRLGPVTCEPVS